MKIKNKIIRIASLFMVMLIVSITCVEAVSANADSSQKEGNSNVVILKETNKEKILSITKKDGSTSYAILCKDEKNSNRVNIGFVDQKDLVAKKLISTASLNDREAVAASISKVKILYVSYVEKYGTSKTGGLHFHFGQRDAEYIISVGAISYGAIGAAGASLLALSSGATIALGAAIGIVVATFYWTARNNDGSLDVRAPYANIGTILVLHKILLKVGSNWYWVKI